MSITSVGNEISKTDVEIIIYLIKYEPTVWCNSKKVDGNYEQRLKELGIFSCQINWGGGI